MRYGILLSVFLAGTAYAQQTQGPITGPSAAPRVPEAATDVPIKAPGPATTGTTASGRSSTDLPTAPKDNAADAKGAGAILTPTDTKK